MVIPRISHYCQTNLPKILNGCQNNEVSIVTQFKIVGQINKCKEVRKLSGLFILRRASTVISKRANPIKFTKHRQSDKCFQIRYKPPESSLSYKNAFYNRTLNKEETLLADAWD